MRTRKASASKLAIAGKETRAIETPAAIGDDAEQHERTARPRMTDARMIVAALKPIRK
jgi:hypothetical protein